MKRFLGFIAIFLGIESFFSVIALGYMEEDAGFWYQLMLANAAIIIFVIVIFFIGWGLRMISE